MGKNHVEENRRRKGGEATKTDSVGQTEKLEERKICAGKALINPPHRNQRREQPDKRLPGSTKAGTRRPRKPPEKELKTAKSQGRMTHVSKKEGQGWKSRRPHREGRKPKPRGKDARARNKVRHFWGVANRAGIDNSRKRPPPSTHENKGRPPRQAQSPLPGPEKIMPRAGGGPLALGGTWREPPSTNLLPIVISRIKRQGGSKKRAVTSAGTEAQAELDSRPGGADSRPGKRGNFWGGSLKKRSPPNGKCSAKLRNPGKKKAVSLKESGERGRPPGVPFKR